MTTQSRGIKTTRQDIQSSQRMTELPNPSFHRTCAKNAQAIEF